MIENIQRRTLTIIEEATAFRRYVNEFGWGGVTELAKILSKSPSYVSKRIRLLDLPKSIQDMIGESKISVSNGEELLLLNENTKCSQLEMLVEDKALSSKELRRVIKDQKNSLDPTDDIVFYSKLDEKKERILKSFDKSIIALRIALGRLGSNIETVEDDWTIFEILMNHKNIINAQIDLLFRERRKYLKAWQKFR
jgi:ParB family chromosome partitioning protein